MPSLPLPLLYTPLQLSSKAILRHRIVMPALTRCRCETNTNSITHQNTLQNTHQNTLQNTTNIHSVYYTQRAHGASLIVTEGVGPSLSAIGYARTPLLDSLAEAAAWKLIVTSVHNVPQHHCSSSSSSSCDTSNIGNVDAAATKDTCLFVMQLMHCGRISHKLNWNLNLRKDTESNAAASLRILAPSAVKPKGEIFTDSQGMVPFDTPEMMTKDDIRNVIDEYARATDLAVNHAGFDGVQLHCANGFLPHQFLATNTNLRDDEYGRNRSKFIIDTLKAMIEAVNGESEKISIKIAPGSTNNDIIEDNSRNIYLPLIELLNPLKLGFIELATLGPQSNDKDITALRSEIRSNYKGKLILGGGYNVASAEDALQRNLCDAIAFGRPFISNPNLYRKFKYNENLIANDKSKYYSKGPIGYIDYPM